MMRRCFGFGAGLMLSACASSGSGVKVDEPALLAQIDEICRSETSGTDLWDTHILAALVAGADANGSGDLDTPEEVRAVPCSVWRRMDAGMQQDQKSDFMATYGFHPQLIWVGSAVGINAALQTMATQQLKSCGLDSGMD